MKQTRLRHAGWRPARPDDFDAQRAAPHEMELQQPIPRRWETDGPRHQPFLQAILIIVLRRFQIVPLLRFRAILARIGSRLVSVTEAAGTTMLTKRGAARLSRHPAATAVRFGSNPMTFSETVNKSDPERLHPAAHKHQHSTPNTSTPPEQQHAPELLTASEFTLALEKTVSSRGRRASRRPARRARKLADARTGRCGGHARRLCGTKNWSSSTRRLRQQKGNGSEHTRAHTHTHTYFSRAKSHARARLRSASLCVLSSYTW